MGLLSIQFYIFFLIVLTVYYLLPGKCQWMWLLAASLFYYFTNSNIQQLIVFACIIIINFIGSRFFSGGNNKRGFYVLLIFNIALLIFLKYPELIQSVSALILKPFSVSFSLSAYKSLTRLLCPMGISYFMLILIGYLTSVYWGLISPVGNPLKLTLFVSFFPMMTSGPIIGYNETGKYFFTPEKKHFSYEHLVKGALRVLWGIFKKLVISERLAIAVNTIYGYYETYTGLYVFLAAALFTLQLYTDFSGLMDIVLGLSETLGITLPENFRTPFYASTLAEFWRRWHITLGEWLRTYVFYPLQRSGPIRKLRKKLKTKLGKDFEKKYNIPVYISLLLTWVLIGFWHGGSLKYIFGVGIYMGVIIMLSDLLQPVFGRLVRFARINTECFSYRLFTRIRTFILFMVGNSFFRAERITDGFKMWKYAFSRFNPWILFDGSLYSLGLDRTEIMICFTGLLLLFIVSLYNHREELAGSGLSVRDLIFRQNLVFQLMVFAFLFAAILAWAHYGTEFEAQNFIYGAF